MKVEDVKLAVKHDEKPKTCRIGSYCQHMERNLTNQVNARATGLVEIEVTSTLDGTKRMIGVAYKTRPADAGTFLNACPWCLAPFHTQVKCSTCGEEYLDPFVVHNCQGAA